MNITELINIAENACQSMFEASGSIVEASDVLFDSFLASSALIGCIVAASQNENSHIKIGSSSSDDEDKITLKEVLVSPEGTLRVTIEQAELWDNDKLPIAQQWKIN